MDKLIINGLELWLKIGCTEAERAFPQRIEMDVTLELSLSAAGKSDDLAQSMDYAAVADALRQKLTPQSFHLIETVAEQAADLVLWKYKPRAVTVLIKKRALPGLAWAGVEIHRP
ncbi:MAG: dihydroneopterin aldolase [Elusimicrobia bacterium]|nr:dihydroneopterin aldolase [Elusimicrobiota bacterium]